MDHKQTKNRDMKRSSYVVDSARLTTLGAPSRHHARIQVKRPKVQSEQFELSLPPRFVQLAPTEETSIFLTQSRVRRSAVKDVLASVLQTAGGYSLTDANATVDRGRMFLFSESHLRALFDGKLPEGKLMLDVGAGDGNVSAVVCSRFEKVVAVETSVPMTRRLAARGYTASSDPNLIFEPSKVGSRCYDLVALLNVLDRCDKPISMLKALKACVKPETGRLLLAVVLPWCPFVEKGTKQEEPSETLDMDGGFCAEGASFERSLAFMSKQVIEPLGFEICSWSKLPYLCEGDGKKDHYLLDDAVFVLKVKEDKETKALPHVMPGVLENPPAAPSVWSSLFGDSKV